MSARFDSVPNRRAIVDRRALADELAALDARDTMRLRQAAALRLKTALEAGRAEIANRLAEHPARGHESAASGAFLMDQLLRVLWDFTVTRLYPNSNPSAAERMALVAVGGYGRGEMAPFSDVDIAFITPWKQTSWSEQVIESMLYSLWDMGLKVGHSSRSLDEMVREAKNDVTIRTALLEGRYVWGDTAVYDEASARFRNDV
uniref:nucleotidyltransferase domain-containing protein n=1 Tax=Sphingomonas sp. TaxID=28214 RepID=UPI0031D4ADBE